jgi:diguanylate cyclase (GGDEF)-like protein
MKIQSTRPSDVSPHPPSVPPCESGKPPLLRSSWTLLLVSTVLICVAVLMAMFIVSQLEELSRETSTLMVGALLIAFLCPAFYLILYRPLQDQVLRLKAAEDEIRSFAFYDLLTGLPNRLLLQERAKQAFAMARRKNRPVAVIFLDLNDFKEINDHFGHAAGDECLRIVAQRLTESVRETDTVARIGGDEFVWVGVVGDLMEAESIAGKVLKNLTRTIRLTEQTVEVGASIGIAIHPRDGDDLDALIKAADGAMYDAKKGGKNSFLSESRHYTRSQVRESSYSYFRN